MKGNWRLNSIFLSILLFAALISWRLIYLQIIKGDVYKAFAQGQSGQNSVENAIDRGEIFLKNGEPLAINKKFFSVSASPSKVADAGNTAKKLSEVLKLQETLVLEKLTKDALYSLIKNRLSEEEVKQLEELKLPGIDIKEEKGRYFPQETLASQVVGFVDANYQGQYGLEGYYNNILKDGKDLNLTIDYNIQFMAEKLLAKAVESLEAEGGLVLVLDPNSGKILTLANFPNFNPNLYKEYAQKGDLEIFQDSAVQKIFEPGSVFKPITMAAALEEQKITPQTTYIDEGILKVGGSTIKNYDSRTYGEQTMTNVLEKSINTGAVFAERQLGHNLFLKYIEKFGFFSKTGIDLTEVYSENREFKKGYDVNFDTAAFGQGIEMTPIQLVRAFSVIANGGKLIKPYVVEKILTPDLSSPILSPKTVSQLTAMMVSVVENGFGKKAGVLGYHIAGKTGTAQVSFSALGIKKSGYSDKTVQSFIGFFPAFNPKFLALVKIDNPKTKTAEYSAIPVFHDLAEYVLHLYQVPPDYE
ncbi:MAG: penicillin-binding protein 2 [Candidatus Wildermuthbacteria bacterium]|nr:penicillin-binding protein 2 [Candidatus Wildermuthbacteria bacterium]